MSWHFSQALEAAYSLESSSAGAPSAPSNTTEPPPRYYFTGRTPDTSRRSRFGMMCAPLTDDHGAALLTWYLVDSLARMSALPAVAKDSLASAPGCGESSPASFARWCLGTSTWKTPQLSLLGDSESFSETWPRWGMMRGGECMELTRPQSRVACESLRSLTTEIESGSVRIGERAPTPTVCGNHNRKGASDTSGDGLATWVRERVPTPVATDGTHGGRCTPRKGREGGNIIEALAGRGYSGLLNPDWVEWLMGWPVGWTDTTREDVETHDWSAEPCPRVTTRRDLRAPRLKQCGNGQVPQCAALAWRILSGSP